MCRLEDQPHGEREIEKLADEETMHIHWEGSMVLCYNPSTSPERMGLGEGVVR